VTQQVDFPANETKSLGEMLSPVRRHFVPFIVVLLLCSVAGLVYVARIPHRYDAKTTVLVTDTGIADTTTGIGSTKSQINLDTEAQIVQSDAVLGQMITNLKLDTDSRSLAKHVAVTVPANTEILSLVVTADTAAEAVREASGVASAYLGNRNSVAATQRDSEIKANDARAADLQDQANKISSQIVSAKNSGNDAARTLLQATYKRLQTQISAIATASNNLELQVISGGRVLTPATATSSGTNVTRLIGVVSGIAVGLFLGFGLAALLDRLRRRVRSGAEVSRMTRLPLLVGQPIVLNRTTDLDPARPPHDLQIARVFTRLRNELDRSGRTARVVLVTGVGAATAHPVAVRLAYTYRRAGRSVALVDRFNWDDESVAVGLATAGDTDLAVQALATISDLAGDAGAEAIIILGPDFATSADAQTLATEADLVLVVVQSGVTRIDDLRDAEAQLEAVGTPAYVVMTEASSAGPFPRLGTLISEPRHDNSARSARPADLGFAAAGARAEASVPEQ
jgi:capsular polysaccharide biosynthesis protein